MLEEVLKTEICDYINNVEDEVFCELTDEEVDEEYIEEHYGFITGSYYA